MKKLIFVLLLIVVLFVSCNASLQVLDEDGFSIYQCGWSISDNQVLIQSHDGFIIDDIFYTEHIVSFTDTYREVEIVNPLSHDINVRITRDNEEWFLIPANSFIVIGD